MLVLAELIVCSTRGFACILAKWFWPTGARFKIFLRGGGRVGGLRGLIRGCNIRRVWTCSVSVCKASMKNHQCEKCHLFKPTVELRSGDELLCDTCWKSPKEHSVLNATAKPFLPRSSGSSIAQRVNWRRSRSTGAIIEMKNSQCETRTSTEKSIIQQKLQLKM